MTRKQALREAIEIVQKTRMNAAKKDEIIESLELCEAELPFAKWSEEAIFDACDQYCIDHNRDYLKLDDFKRGGLPSHPTIKNRFGLTAKEFRDKYYPLKNPNKKHPVYSHKSCEEYTNDFVAQYRSVNPKSAVEYNKLRPKGYPTWSVVAAMNGVTTWCALLKLFNLDKKPVSKLKVISISESGSIELLKKLIAENNARRNIE